MCPLDTQIKKLGLRISDSKVFSSELNAWRINDNKDTKFILRKFHNSQTPFLRSLQIQQINNTHYWFNAKCEKRILKIRFLNFLNTGCPKKHGNSVTICISSLLWISIVIPNFKSHNIIMSARVYLMKTVNGCKDVSIMTPKDEQ